MSNLTILERLDRLEQAIDTSGYVSPTVAAVRAELYQCLCYWGGFPEPQGDVPERYHRWDDLTEVARRLVDNTMKGNN